MAHREPRPQDPRFERPSPPAAPAPGDFLGLGDALAAGTPHGHGPAVHGSSRPAVPHAANWSSSSGSATPHAPNLRANAQHANTQHANSQHAPLRPSALPPRAPDSHRDAESALQWLDDASTAVLEETRRHQAFVPPQATPPPTAQPTAMHAQPTQPQVPAAPPARPSLMSPPTYAPAQAAPTRPNSWLLSLDDAAAGRAGTGPVVPDSARVLAPRSVPAPLSASFSEPPPVVERTMPWVVRGLLAAGAGGFLLVVAYTLTRPRMTEPSVPEIPIPAVATSRTSAVELEAPPPAREPLAADTTARGKSDVRRAPAAATPRAPVAARPAPNPARPKAAVVPARPIVPEAPPVKLEIPPAEFAPDLRPPPASPDGSPPNARAGATSPANGPDVLAANVLPAAAWPTVSTRGPMLALDQAGPRAEELAGSPERRERVERWLFAASRGAAPDLDASPSFPAARRAAETASPVSAATDVAPVAADDVVLAADPNESEPIAQADAPVTAPVTAPSAVAPIAADLDAVLDAAATVPATGAAAATATTPSGTANAGAARPSSVARWEGGVVPVEQIDAKSRVLTPNVGRVRVTLDGGDTIEGDLYAVGEGRVWVDARVGRIALGREQITRLEQVARVEETTATPDTNDARPVAPAASAPATPAAPAPAAAPAPKDDTLARTDDATALTPNTRVRVRNAGGVFYGRIEGRDGDSITLVTDEGAWVTVDRADVELAPARKTIVKPKTGPGGRPLKPAPKPAPKPDPKPAPGSGVGASLGGQHPG